MTVDIIDIAMYYLMQKVTPTSDILVGHVVLAVLVIIVLALYGGKKI